MSRFVLAFHSTLRAILTTRALFSTAILALLVYGFYYPLPYSHQAARQIPMVVVDQENSALTRRVVRALADIREVRISAYAESAEEAAALVRRRQADGILLLPRGFTRGLLAGAPGGGLAVWVNGAYLLRARDIGNAVEQAVGAAARDELGQFADALHLTPPITIIDRPLFNTREGYADYVFPAVSVVILQQTLLFASAMLMAGGRQPTGLDAVAGTWLALILIGSAGSFFYFGFVFWAQDVPRAGNVPALLIAVPIFAAAVAALGMLLGTAIDRPERAMAVLAPSSVPVFFLSGAAWPLSSMPDWVQLLAHFSPATWGVHAFVRLNQMGGSLSEAGAPIAGISVLALLYGGTAAAKTVSRRKTLGPPPERST